MSFRRENLVLPLFFIAALIPRIMNLSVNPPGLFRDEVEKLYHSWTLWNHGGETLEGQIFPLFFRIEGATTSGIYHYFSAPFIWGRFASPAQGRLVIALVGIISILVLITILGRIFSYRGAMIAGILLAFSPWHFLLSRWIQQGIFLPFFLAVFLLFFHQLKEKGGLLFAFLSGVSLGLALYSYAVANLLIPLLVAGLVIIYRREYSLKQWTVFFCGLALLALPVIEQQLFQGSPEPSRFSRISVFNTPYPVTVFFLNYLRHLSPYHLFITGDANLRHSFPGIGMFHWYTFPLFLTGLVYLLKNYRNSFYRLLLWMFIVSPVPASLTTEGIPHYLRAIPFLLMGEIIIAAGLIKIFQKVPKVFRWSSIAITANLLVFLVVVFYFFPVKSLLYWDADFFKEGLEEARILQERKDLPIYISRNVLYRYYLYGYYTRQSPAQVRKSEEANVYFSEESITPPYLVLHYNIPEKTVGRTILSAAQNSIFLVSLVDPEEN